MSKEDLINFGFSTERPSIIKVLGVGGGGSNAVNHMFIQGIRDVEFLVCNTDSQALAKSPVPVKIQLGQTLTEGLGAGNLPEQGRQAAVESIEEVTKILADNTRMVFITAGMGGGTGTGAAPVIAKATREMGLLTVAIVTIPFQFEGPRRRKQAIEGLNELKEYVDSLLVINNEKLREIHGDLPVSEAFARADDVLTIAAKGIAEIITVPGHVNVDFADVRTVMTNSGVAIMGSGTADGENRAMEALNKALTSPLLNNNDIRGARNILLNITSGSDEITMDEICRISDYVQDAAGSNADMILGSCTDPSLGSSVNVTIIATGFSSQAIPELYTATEKGRNVVNLGMQKPAETTQKKMNFVDPDESSIAQDISKERKTVYTNMDDSQNVDNLENVPAFVRKKLDVEQKNYSDESTRSGYTVTGGKDGFRLRENNSYLHDNVD